MNICSELSMLQSFNERAAITKFSAVGTWESISIPPPLFFSEATVIKGSFCTWNKWSMAPGSCHCLSLSPPISRQCILGSCWDLRKMSLPDTVLFWFRSQIAWLSFYIDNKEVGRISQALQPETRLVLGEEDWSFCPSCSTLDLDVWHQIDLTSIPLDGGGGWPLQGGPTWFLGFLGPSSATLTTLYQGSVTSFCHGDGEGERKPG